MEHNLFVLGIYILHLFTPEFASYSFHFQLHFICCILFCYILVVTMTKLKIVKYKIQLLQHLKGNLLRSDLLGKKKNRIIT